MMLPVSRTPGESASTLSEEIFGQRERKRIGIKDVGVPELRQPSDPVAGGGRAPRPAEDPQLTASREITGHVAVEPRTKASENYCED